MYAKYVFEDTKKLPVVRKKASRIRMNVSPTVSGRMSLSI